MFLRVFGVQVDTHDRQNMAQQQFYPLLTGQGLYRRLGSWSGTIRPNDVIVARHC